MDVLGASVGVRSSARSSAGRKSSSSEEDFSEDDEQQHQTETGIVDTPRFRLMLQQLYLLIPLPGSTSDFFSSTPRDILTELRSIPLVYVRDHHAGKNTFVPPSKALVPAFASSDVVAQFEPRSGHGRNAVSGAGGAGRKQADWSRRGAQQVVSGAAAGETESGLSDAGLIETLLEPLLNGMGYHLEVDKRLMPPGLSAALNLPRFDGDLAILCLERISRIYGSDLHASPGGATARRSTATNKMTRLRSPERSISKDGSFSAVSDADEALRKRLHSDPKFLFDLLSLLFLVVALEDKPNIGMLRELAVVPVAHTDGTSRGMFSKKKDHSGRETSSSRTVRLLPAASGQIFDGAFSVPLSHVQTLHPGFAIAKENRRVGILGIFSRFWGSGSRGSGVRKISSHQSLPSNHRNGSHLSSRQQMSTEHYNVCGHSLA